MTNFSMMCCNNVLILFLNLNVSLYQEIVPSENKKTLKYILVQFNGI